MTELLPCQHRGNLLADGERVECASNRHINGPIVPVAWCPGCRYRDVENIDLVALRAEFASPGLGDAIEKALTFVGITKERVESWVGAPCGCAERQQKLNNLGAWALSILGRTRHKAAQKLQELIGEDLHG